MPVSKEAKASAKKYYETKIVPQLETNNQVGMTADEYAQHRWEIEKPNPIQESIHQVSPQAPRELAIGSVDPFANHVYGSTPLNRRNKYARKIHRQELREDRLRNRFINAAANGQINRTARLAAKLNDFE